MFTATHKPPCFAPRSYHELMVQITDTDENIITMSSVDGLSFNATYFTVVTHQPHHTVEINLQPDQKVHFVKSQYPGWYYILQFSNLYQRFGCSCRDGKQYQQTRTACSHMQLMQR